MNFQEKMNPYCQVKLYDASSYLLGVEKALSQ
jgi:hypothetical protein